MPAPCHHSFRKQFAKFLEDDVSSEDIEDMFRCVDVAGWPWPEEAAPGASATDFL